MEMKFEDMLKPIQKMMDVTPEDFASNYNYAINQAQMAARTATEIEMQKYAAQRQMDIQKYELEKALKQQLQDALVYGTGAISQTAGAANPYANGAAGGAGYAQAGGGAGGGSSFTTADLEQAFRDAYQGFQGGGRTLTGKEQCPVLYRLLSELLENSSFSARLGFSA